MRDRLRKLLSDLALVRRYRAARAQRLPFRIRLPFVRDRIRRQAHDDWPGGYVFGESGDIFHVPRPVDNIGGYLLLKPVRRVPIVGAICQPGEVVADVGANAGGWTISAARAVGPGGRVLAFEPVPRIAESLRRTVRVNRLRQVRVFELALAETTGTRAFSVERENPGGSRLDTMENRPGRTFDAITVKAARLDDIAAAENLQRLDLVKIDVEGFEHGVLSGARETLARLAPAIYMETGHETAERRAGTAALLQELRYEIVGVMIGDGIIEAGWREYERREGVFEAFPLGDMLLMPAGFMR